MADEPTCTCGAHSEHPDNEKIKALTLVFETLFPDTPVTFLWLTESEELGVLAFCHSDRQVMEMLIKAMTRIYIQAKDPSVFHGLPLIPYSPN